VSSGWKEGIMSSRNSKKQLAVSAASLLVCAALFAGTTYAWFTDSASSGISQIKSGNLDLTMEYYDAASQSYVSAENVDLFDSSALWEPGYTQVVYLKLSNTGSLALDETFTLDVQTETAGTSVSGNSYKLSDVLQYAVFDYTYSADGNWQKTRDEIQALSSSALSTPYQDADICLQPGETKYAAVAVWMPASTGNEANPQTGSTPPSITLKLDAQAKQAQSESDSFGNDYDADAEYGSYVYVPGVTYTFDVNGEDVDLVKGDNGLFTNADDSSDKTVYLADADSWNAFASLTQTADGIKGNSTVVLANDIDLGGQTVEKAYSGNNRLTGTFDGGGHTISNGLVKRTSSYGAGLIADSVSCTVKNLTVENIQVATNGSAGYAPNIVGGLVAYNYGNSTFENIHIKNATIRGFGKTGGIVGMNGEPGSTVTFKNCSVENSTIIGTYDNGGLIGLSLGPVVLEGTNDTSTVTFQPLYSYDSYVDLEATVSCTEPYAASCPKNGYTVKGNYWDDAEDGYYWGGYDAYGWLYGDGSHDCQLANDTHLLANSEHPIGS
jgi:predicted ribosomally synthesized peptide with SipW-like signal peptide